MRERVPQCAGGSPALCLGRQDYKLPAEGTAWKHVANSLALPQEGLDRALQYGSHWPDVPVLRLKHG